MINDIEGCPIYTNWYDPCNGILLFARPVRFVPVVHVVKLLFTGRTVGGLQIIERLGAYIQVHDPYDSYGSWNNGLRVVQLVNCISLEELRAYIQVHDPYDSYGLWKNGLRVVQLVNCISLEELECIYKSTSRASRETMVYQSYKWWTAY